MFLKNSKKIKAARHIQKTGNICDGAPSDIVNGFQLLIIVKKSSVLDVTRPHDPPLPTGVNKPMIEVYIWGMSFITATCKMGYLMTMANIGINTWKMHFIILKTNLVLPQQVFFIVVLQLFFISFTHCLTHECPNLALIQ